MVTSKKKKKRSSLTLRQFFCPALEIFYKANLPERHEIAQTFDAILPKEYEIARNFDAKSPKNLPEIWTPNTNQGSGAPPAPPPPTPMTNIIKHCFYICADTLHIQQVGCN